MSDSLQPIDSPWHSPGQNTGAHSLSLLQQIFPTQGSNPGLLHLQADPLPAEPQGKLSFHKSGDSKAFTETAGMAETKATV